MLPRDAETIAAVLRSSDVDVTGSGPARTLLRLADDRDADLIAVASHGRGGIGRANRVALGSEPTRLIADSTRPGIVVPASGAASFGHVAPACLRASA
jgi:nucleotide-binding universal stress UspA family protein